MDFELTAVPTLLCHAATFLSRECSQPAAAFRPRITAARSST